MLKNAGGVAHPLEMPEAECRKRLGVSKDRGSWRKTPATGLEALARLLEDLGVISSHLGPHHAPAHEVGLFPHRMAPGLVGKKVQHGRGNRLVITEGHKHTTILREKFRCMPVGG